MSSVPRMVQMPRFEAKITIGEIVLSRALLRYVKHSMSSMWTYRELDVVTNERGGLYFIDEEDSGD